MIKKYLNMMLNQIERHEAGLVPLRVMHENLWMLFELIDKDELKGFSKKFHEHWDHIEEIISVEKINEYMGDINNDILPSFKQNILEYL